MSASAADSIRVEVVYATLGRQDRVKLLLAPGSTVAAAIDASGVQQKYPEIDLTKNKVGVFSKLAKMDTVLRDQDRVEIYRPLIADPKEVRKQRAAQGKLMKKGG